MDETPEHLNVQEEPLKELRVKVQLRTQDDLQAFSVMVLIDSGCTTSVIDEGFA